MMDTKLKRETFRTSRLLEFFSEKELSMQIGYNRTDWLIAMTKELVDNSLDACESSGALPDIEINLMDDSISVKDNGPGLPEDVITGSQDYAFRVSDKNHYVSPSRGQLGNALKCLFAVPFVLNGEHGRVDIETDGKAHSVDVSINRISQEPVIELTVADSFVKNGTFVKMNLKDLTSSTSNSPNDFYKLAENYAALNPHATFSAGGHTFHRTATACQKWTPSSPTSAFWYTPEQLRNLIAAMVSNGSQKTLRAFMSEFRGLSSSQKQKKVVDSVGMSRAALSDLVHDGDIPMDTIESLLSAMKAHSRPIKPKALGVIGDAHIKQWMGETIASDSFKYKISAGEIDGLPFVLEVAFGIFQEDSLDRETITGLNWTPTLSSPFQQLYWILNEAEVDEYDPVQILIHLASPVLNFTDRGKSKISLPQLVQSELKKSLLFVCKEFTRQKRKTERGERMQLRRLQELREMRKPEKVTIKDAAYQVMGWAYRETSGIRNLPAPARNIMYKARPKILELTGRKSLNDKYFTQTLLPDYINEHPEETKAWDVVFDARGKIIEPHTNKRVDLGTLQVRNYISSWGNGNISDNISFSMPPGNVPTSGPTNRYEYALYIEKEGFEEVLKADGIQQQYDIAIASNKGLTVVATRELVQNFSAMGVTTLVLHDFDKAGFSIVNTLRNDTRRWVYDEKPLVIDIGLRLQDVEKMGLEKEVVDYGHRVKKDPRINLKEGGATDEECNFLVEGGGPGTWHGHRVELNAMTSEQFVEFIRNKLDVLGIEKIVPDEGTLTKAYVKAYRRIELQKIIDKIIGKIQKIKVDPPKNLEEVVRNKLKDFSSQPWDSAVINLAETAASQNEIERRPS